ncbi:hypothetical protein OG763_15230 [Streptomyces sp. NBC_01230]|uniref:hypothetical protein n=1 Tax=Streptomyces sp. NBC_01230 TaxID=2903784 RepID=UPI002E0FD969|nr:hypothetical protein OG763_15230 [Streptomyces sp. NBC_01230]
MSELVLTAVIAAVVLLPASIVAHRTATAPVEEPHQADGCRQCAALARVPRPRGGDQS